MIFMKIKESGPGFELLKDIVHLLIKTTIDEQIMPLERLQDNIKYDK